MDLIPKSIENNNDCDNSIQELNKLVQNIGMKIRKNKRGWLGKKVCVKFAVFVEL